MGAEVLALQADVSNKEEMKRVINEAEDKFGALHGVIHAAGLMDERYYSTITDLERENCETHFTAKIRGLAVLDEVLKDKDPDFCILNTSISSILGGLTLYAYSAASSFMDAFAQKQNQVMRTNWLTINWDDWEKDKSQVKNAGPSGSAGTLRVLSKTSEEGKEAFKRVLFLNKIPQVIVSMVDLYRLLNQWVLVDTDPGNSDQRETSGAVLVAHQRPQLQSIFEAPQNEAEKIIAEIWQELLAINPIGVHDNFFELGGHSLLATKLISRLREIFKIDLPLNILFDKPTVREVVDNIAHTWGDREVVEEIARTYREVFS
jgi:acyl carrier protein